MPPRDIFLYEKVKKQIYKKYPKHSAYRSGLLVQKYKKDFNKKYRNKNPYIGNKTKKKGLQRWFGEKWVNQRGEVGYKYKNDVYRPSKRITKKTPITHNELTKKEIKRARKIKYTRGRVKRFRGGMTKKAKALFKKKNKVSGSILFEKLKKGVKVNYDIKGLKNGKHGFHIHENGDFKGDCVKAGPHFNPLGHSHSGRKNKKRHIGDLGNVNTRNGKTKGSFIDYKISLSGKNNIVGRSIVVHELKDDLGKGNDEESLNTGNAGARLNCAKIFNM